MTEKGKGPEMVYGKVRPTERDYSQFEADEESSKETVDQALTQRLDEVRRRLVNLREKRIKKGMRKETLTSGHTDDKGDPNIFDLTQIMTGDANLDEYVRYGAEFFDLAESTVYPDDGKDEDLDLAERALRDGADMTNVVEFDVSDKEDEMQDEALAKEELKEEKRLFAKLVNGGFFNMLDAEGRSINGVKGSPEEIDPTEFVVISGRLKRVAELIQKGLRTERAEASLSKMFAKKKEAEERAAHFDKANAEWEKAQFENNVAAIERMMKSPAVLAYFETRQKIEETISNRDLNAEWEQCETLVRQGKGIVEKNLRKDLREYRVSGAEDWTLRLNKKALEQSKAKKATPHNPEEQQTAS